MPSGTNWDKIRREGRARRNGTVSIREEGEKIFRKKKKPKEHNRSFKSQPPPKEKPLTELDKKLIRQVQQNTKARIEAMERKRLLRKKKGIGAKDLLWVSEHAEPHDYTKNLCDNWVFDRYGRPYPHQESLPRAIHAVKCEYFCYGFPPVVVKKIKEEIHQMTLHMSLSVFELEEKVLKILSLISLRVRFSFIGKGILRQSFYVHKKALRRAAQFNPRLFSCL